MVWMTNKFILLRYVQLQIFHCEARSLSIRSLELHPNCAIQFHREGIFSNGWAVKLNYKGNNIDIFRRFLCNTQTNIDAPNAKAEPIPGEVQAFKKYLKDELDATKLKLDQTKNWAIEKYGYIKLRIEDISGSQIQFDLKKVI